MTHRSVLVTGGAGFIGSAFVRHVLEVAPDARVVTLDALTYAGTRRNLDGLDADRHRFVEGDISDRALVERVLRDEAVTLVVHLAAETHVDRSILDPKAFVETNVVGTQALLETARSVWLADGPRDNVRFHHVSTDEVFGDLGPDDPPFSETTPYAPSSPYSASKAASDHLVRAYARTYGLPVSISNCSNNYGPRQFPEKLIPVVLLRALGGEPIPLYGDGRQRRDWLYVDDHAAAIWEVATRAVPGCTYTVGGDAEVDNLTIVQTLCSILDARFPDAAPHADLITFVTDRPGHDRRYAIDASRIREDLGWTPSETLASGLDKTVEWTLANGAWLEAVARDKGLDAWLDRNYRDRLALS